MPRRRRVTGTAPGKKVLEKLGWRLHRVWSTEWFQRRHQEVERLSAALEAARKPVEPAEAETKIPSPPPPIRKVEIGTPASAGAKLPGTAPYRVATLKVDKKAAKADLQAPSAQARKARQCADRPAGRRGGANPYRAGDQTLAASMELEPCRR